MVDKLEYFDDLNEYELENIDGGIGPAAIVLGVLVVSAGVETFNGYMSAHSNCR